MPCNGGHTYSPPDHKSCEDYEKKLIAENDELTRLLCYLCGRLTGEDRFVNMPAQLVGWWRKHQKLDHRRVTRQMDDRLDRHGIVTPTELSEDFIKKAQRKHPLSAFHANWLFAMAVSAVERYQDKLQKKAQKLSLREKALRKLTAAERKALGLARVRRSPRITKKRNR